MNNIALRMDGVSKKFHKGERFSSLRDLLPNITRNMFRSVEVCDEREFWALRDISFEVTRGEAFGIIGPNGAGKSTMLKILSRLIVPTCGSFSVDGRISALIELAAGFHHDLTGRENIFLYGSILGMTRAEVAARLDEIVEFSGLAEFIDTPVKRYSSGMYARLGFSVAAHVQPDILIVDEVLSVGDYVFQRKCVQHMRNLVASGTTVLFVSHNLKSIAEFCDRCLLLEKGHVVTTGPAQNVISAYIDRSLDCNVRQAEASAVSITSVRVRNEFGEASDFESGDRAYVDILITARERVEKLSVTLYIISHEFEHVFDTSTERLTHETITLDADESSLCTFEVQLNMTGGIYYVAALIYRYDNQTTYDRREPATTIYVSSSDDVRGKVHCFPKLIHQQIGRDAGRLLSVSGVAGAQNTSGETPQSETIRSIYQ